MSQAKLVAVVGDKDTLPLFRMLGMIVEEAGSQEEAITAVRKLSARDDVGLIIVLKHVVRDEESFRASIDGVATPVYILPTKWAPGEPIRVEKLVAKALGLG